MNMKGTKMWKVGWLTAICLLLMSGFAIAQESQGGKISGFIFHDANRDGVYKPADEDDLLGSVQIVVQADSTGEVVMTETDVRGGYEFTGLKLDELYTVQVNPSTLPIDKFPAATAGADSVGAIAWVVFLSSQSPEPNTVVLPSEAVVSFGFGPASPTTVAVSEIGATSVSWLYMVVLFTTLGVATQFVIFD